MVAATEDLVVGRPDLGSRLVVDNVFSSNSDASTAIIALNLFSEVFHELALGEPILSVPRPRKHGLAPVSFTACVT